MPEDEKKKKNISLILQPCNTIKNNYKSPNFFLHKINN